MDTTKVTDLYVDYAGEVTDAPRLYAQWLGYLVLSCVVNKNIWMDNGGFMRLYPNLYLLIIGPSSVYRKSFSQKLAASFVKEIYPDFQLVDFSSRESFISDMARTDRTPSTCGLMLVDEMKGFMDRCKTSSHFAGMIQEISSTFTADTIQRRVGVSEKEKTVFRVDEPFLNFSGACSFDWLSQAVETSDITGGFLARFLWIIAPQKDSVHWPEPRPGDKMKRAMIIDRLNVIKDIIGQMIWEDEAKELWAWWYSDFREKNQGGKWDANFERMTVQVKKLAMLNAAQQNRTEIKAIDLSEAIEIVEPLVEALGGVAIGENPEDILRQRILGFMRSRKNKAISRSELLNNIRGLDKRRLDGAIETLIDAELISSEEAKANGDNLRPRVRFRLKSTGAEHRPSARPVDTPEEVPF